MFEETGFKVYFFIFKNNIRNNLPIEEFRTYFDVYWEEEFKDWNRDINKFKRIKLKYFQLSILIRKKKLNQTNL